MKSQSIPLPLTQTFTQYFHLAHRLRKHYLSPRVFLYLVTGQFVPPIHRKNLYSLQYSMLPVQRVSMGELWTLLSDDGRRFGSGGLFDGVGVSGGSGSGSGAGMNGAMNGNGFSSAGSGGWGPGGGKKGNGRLR